MKYLLERKEISRPRTCGAAHNSSSRSSSSTTSSPKLDDEEKMKQRAELLYPTMKEKENNNVEKSDFEYIMPTESGYISSYYGKKKISWRRCKYFS